MISFKPTTQGFTLVETLVAIAILLIAIITPFYSIQQAITASYISRDQLIATSLAQEGLEYIYFLRENNYLAVPTRNWLIGMDNCRTDSPYNHTNGCTVDPAAASGQLVSCSAGGCVPLNLNASGIYTQAAGSPITRFTRTVKVTPVPSNSNQIVVTVQVSWSTNRQTYMTTVRENLYNWL